MRDAPRGGGRGGVPARARPQGGPRRAPRRPRPPLGRGGPQPPVGGRRPRARGRPTTRSCRPGSSCTAAPAGPATGCCSRSRTAWPRPSARSRPTRSCTRSPPPPARSRGAATTRGSGSTRRCAARSGWRSRRDRPIGAGPRAARRRGAPHRRRRSRPPTRAWCCGRPRPRRPATPGSTAARSTGWRRRRGALPDAVARRRARGRWSTCSSPGTAPSRWSRRSTRWASGCTCSRSGRPCAASRSATPTTASPSTGT